MEKISKVICKECGIEYNENMYYLSRIEHQKRMEVCKGCFESEVSKDVLATFRKYDIPFIYNVWWDSSNNGNLQKYMKNINSLPQYIHFRWKDSILNNAVTHEEVEANFYDKIVKSLKDDAKKLNDKLSIAMNNSDMQLYISTIKSLRDTLDLISKYDWRLMHSEYRDEQARKQVSVWEQNHDNQIRNHKVWNVIEKIDVTTEPTKEKVPMYIDFEGINVHLNDNSKNLGICSGKVIIYYMDKFFTLEKDGYLIRDYANEIKNIVDFIEESNGGKIVVLVNTQGFGQNLYDELLQLKSIEAKELQVKSI